MASGEVVETFYGKKHKYEVIRKKGGVFTSDEFYIRKDGQHFKGPYNDLSVAVERAEEASES